MHKVPPRPAPRGGRFQFPLWKILAFMVLAAVAFASIRYIPVRDVVFTALGLLLVRYLECTAVAVAAISFYFSYPRTGDSTSHLVGTSPPSSRSSIALKIVAVAIIWMQCAYVYWARERWMHGLPWQPPPLGFPYPDGMLLLFHDVLEWLNPTVSTTGYSIHGQHLIGRDLLGLLFLAFAALAGWAAGAFGRAISEFRKHPQK